MSTLERIYTRHDLRQLETLPENADKRFELIRGVIYELAFPSPTHNLLVGNIYAPLREFAKARNLGFVFTDSVQYSLHNNDDIAPDVSFVSFARQAPPAPKDWTIAPDMAVEIVSPSNREREMQDKIESLLESGTRFVWVVYPKSQIVDVWRMSSDGDIIVHKVDKDGILNGEDVLPGFTLAVKEIFDLP
jgi:Uma2 family endonuclease